MNIALIGFMGSGKSVVGRELAKELKYKLRDTDTLIENRSNKLISEIFATDGEEYFRNMETQIIDELTAYDNQIISCGGGAILRNENVDYLKKNSLLIYLKAPFEVLYDRIKLSTNRPLLTGDDPEEEARQLLEARQSVYERVADLSIDTGKKTINEVVDEIVRLVEKKKEE